VDLMSDQPATAQATRRQSAVRGAIAALAAAGCVSLLVVAIVSPSPAIAVVLCACAVATGVLVARSVPRVLPIAPGARRALAEFRRELHALPETEHPIGL
jgi:hypothetical protein